MQNKGPTWLSYMGRIVGLMFHLLYIFLYNSGLMNRILIVLKMLGFTRCQINLGIIMMLNCEAVRRKKWHFIL
jgi:hypothetical protein